MEILPPRPFVLGLLILAPLCGCSKVAGPDERAVRPSIAEFALIDPAEGVSSLEVGIAENLVIPVLPRGGEETDYVSAVRCARAAQFLTAIVDTMPSALGDRDRQTLQQTANQLNRRAERIGLQEGMAPAEVSRDLAGSEILIGDVAATPEEKLRVALSCMQEMQS